MTDKETLEAIYQLPSMANEIAMEGEFEARARSLQRQAGIRRKFQIGPLAGDRLF